MSTPQATDTFSRIMAGLFNEQNIINVSTGFQTFFGNPANGSLTIFSPDAEVVDIDIMRGNEKIAALIQRGSVGRTTDSPNLNTNDQKFTNFSRKYPLIEQTSDITSTQISKRVAGENPFSNLTRENRMAILAVQEHEEHIRRMVRLHEVLASQSVRTGFQDVIFGTTNSDLQYDFRRNAANSITVGTVWTDGAATIIDDVDDGCDQFRVASKTQPDMAVIGGAAMSAFINNSDVQSQADNRRFELIQISNNFGVPERFNRWVEAGFNARGRLRTPQGYELWLFTTVDGAEINSSFVKYMPDDEMIIASSAARADRYFGPSDTLPNTATEDQFYRETFGFDSRTAPMPEIKNAGAMIMPQMFYFDAYPGKARKSITHRTQSAPIFATTQTDAFVLLEGLI